MFDRIVKGVVSGSLLVIAFVMLMGFINDHRIAAMKAEATNLSRQVVALVNDLQGLECEGVADVIQKYFGKK